MKQLVRILLALSCDVYKVPVSPIEIFVLNDLVFALLERHTSSMHEFDFIAGNPLKTNLL